MGKKKIDDALMLEMLRSGKKQKEIAEHFGCSIAAVSKRIKHLVPMPKTFEVLTEKEKTFVVGVAAGKSKTQSAAEAYDCVSRDSAKALGHNLSKTPHIQQAVSDLMKYHGLTRSYRIGRVKDHVDDVDPNVSLKALDMSWKLDGSYAPTKSVNVNANLDISPVDLTPYLLHPQRDEEDDNGNENNTKKGNS